MSIWLTGDFAPTQGTEECQFDIDLSPLDVWIINLETPITRGLPAREKAGPTLNGRIEALAEFASRTRVVAILANNHAMDFGADGVSQTLDACAGLGIQTVGVGDDLKSALEPIVIEHEGTRIGIVAFAESQYGMAGVSSAGVAPLLPGRASTTVRRLKQDVDIVIASADGGAELSPWPSPRRQDMMGALVDSGADFIHGHHAHVPQGYEQIDGRMIFYGLGNFLVSPANWKSSANSSWSSLVKIDIENGGASSSVYSAEVTSTQSGCRVGMVSETDNAGRSKYLDQCNQPLANPRLLAALWQEVSVDLYNHWFKEWLGFASPRDSASESLMRILDEMRNAVTGSGKKSLELLRYHLFACESHSEAISTALGVLSGEMADLRDPESKRMADSMLPWRM